MNAEERLKQKIKKSEKREIVGDMVFLPIVSMLYLVALVYVIVSILSEGDTHELLYIEIGGIIIFSIVLIYLWVSSVREIKKHFTLDDAEKYVVRRVWITRVKHCFQYKRNGKEYGNRTLVRVVVAEDLETGESFEYGDDEMKEPCKYVILENLVMGTHVFEPLEEENRE